MMAIIVALGMIMQKKLTIIGKIDNSSKVQGVSDETYLFYFDIAFFDKNNFMG